MTNLPVTSAKSRQSFGPGAMAFYLMVIIGLGVGLALWLNHHAQSQAAPVPLAARSEVSASNYSAIIPDQSHSSISAALRIQIQDGIETGRAQCFHLIHHDTLPYEQCLKTLIDQTQALSARRLGLSYFGWVGAMNSVRVGMRGADVTAWYMQQTFLPIQHHLNISDAALCAMIDGNCTVRIAQLKQQLAASKPTPAQLDENGEDGDHHAQWN